MISLFSNLKLSAVSAIVFITLFNNCFLIAQDASLEATLSLKNVDGINIPYQNKIPVPSFEKQKRAIQNLRGTWQVQRFAASDLISLSKRDFAGYNNLVAETQSRFTKNFDDKNWGTKQLPSVENKMNIFPQPPELLPNSLQPDGVWYRKTFQVDAANAGKTAKLIFYAVNYVADIWLNDQYLGYHEGGYTPFAFEVTPNIIPGGSNVIAIRIDNPEWGKRIDIVPYVKCDWFNYSGVIHDIYLEFSDPVSVVRTDIVPKDTEGNMQTTIVLQNRTDLEKNIDMKIEVFEADVHPFNIKTEHAADLIGAPAVVEGITSYSFSLLKDSVKAVRTNLRVTNPKLWTPKEPNLYIMKVSLYESGILKDEYSTQFGIRTISQSGSKILLNGKPIFLTGTARHEDHPLFGRSVPIDTIYTDLLKVQQLNANILRTAHYPNHPFTYLITDRLGIVAVEEIPVWWFDDARAWQHQNNRQIHQQMFREMVFKDYNRPSIFFWSTSNECADVLNRKLYTQKINNDLDQNYPDGRLITQSAAADRPGSYDDSQNACDVAGWTMYFGVFHGSTYYDGTKNFIESAHKNFSNKPVLNTEFGYWSGENMSQFSKQVTVFNETFRAFKEKAVMNADGTLNTNGFMLGTTWWCAFDWYQYKETYNSYQTMGLITMDRKTLKPVAGVLKTAYAPYFNAGGVATSIKETDPDEIPHEFNLMQNFPNPFNPETVISYHLPVSSHVSLKVYDLLGREVATLVNEVQQPGKYNSKLKILNSQLTSGIYLYRLTTDKYSLTKKMLLLK